MIIACPACTTRYVVPDSAIGVEGRTVRCAKCRHSWHQDGATGEEEAGKERAVEERAEDKSAVEKTAIDETAPANAKPLAEPVSPAEPATASRPGFGDTHGAPAEPVATNHDVPNDPAPLEQDEQQKHSDFADPYVGGSYDGDSYDADPYEDGVSQFDHRPPFHPRRNPLKIWTAAGVAFALLAFGGVFAVSYFGFPDWVPISRPTFAVAEPDLVLDFPDDQQDRRTLPDGSEFFSASGTITNIGRETRNVPSILIVMRNEREVPVYSWVLAPPEDVLAPGETVTINEIATDVPKSAKYADIGWNPT
ncbi:MAG: zinc-ribbon domain-containing protein [Pontixanthobacter sp.]